MRDWGSKGKTLQPPASPPDSHSLPPSFPPSLPPMRVILTLLRKDIANFLRNRTVVGITFIIPAVLIYIFGYVFGLRGNDDPKGVKLAVVNESSHPAAQKLVSALQAEKAFRVVTSYESADKTAHLL